MFSTYLVDNNLCTYSWQWKKLQILKYFKSYLQIYKVQSETAFPITNRSHIIFNYTHFWGYSKSKTLNFSLQHSQHHKYIQNLPTTIYKICVDSCNKIINRICIRRRNLIEKGINKWLDERHISPGLPPFSPHCLLVMTITSAASIVPQRTSSCCVPNDPPRNHPHWRSDNYWIWVSHLMQNHLEFCTWRHKLYSMYRP